MVENEMKRRRDAVLKHLLGAGAIRPYRVLWVAAVMVSSVVPLPAVWSFADVANGPMAVANLVCLLATTGEVASEMSTYFRDSDRQ